MSAEFFKKIHRKYVHRNLIGKSVLRDLGSHQLQLQKTMNSDDDVSADMQHTDDIHKE